MLRTSRGRRVAAVWGGVFLWAIGEAGAQAPPANSQTSAGLAETAESWMATFETGDAAAIADYFADDVVAHYPGWTQPTLGRAANEEAWARYFERRPHHPLSTDRVVEAASGDMGYTMGQGLYAAATNPEATGGRYVAIWHRIDGEWKVVVFAAHTHADVTSETFRAGRLYP